MESITVREVRMVYGKPRKAKAVNGQVSSPEALATLFRGIIGDETRETFAAVYLDARHNPIGWHIVSIGTVSESLVHPREVFRPAIAIGASAIAVAHNHPSGDPSPSREDRSVTERLGVAGALLGIRLLDHVIIGEDRHYSFKASGGIA